MQNKLILNLGYERNYNSELAYFIVLLSIKIDIIILKKDIDYWSYVDWCRLVGLLSYQYGRTITFFVRKCCSSSSKAEFSLVMGNGSLSYGLGGCCDFEKKLYALNANFLSWKPMSSYSIIYNQCQGHFESALPVETEELLFKKVVGWYVKKNLLIIHSSWEVEQHD